LEPASAVWIQGQNAFSILIFKFSPNSTYSDRVSSLSKLTN
jgi:hypothetical protein